ncbi:MAG: ATP-binding cassette domain-containing protein [Lachnospiraceae bacterium]|nr:ATP-binding cassette domain-containing protein [Lachnospiraceae bacterium]
MLVEIRDGTVSRQGREVLSHIDFEIHGTEKIAVVGRNGAGKTTLLQVLAGELSLDGNDRNPASGLHFSRAVTVGMLRQQPVEHPEWTVEELCRRDFPEAEWEGNAWEYDRLFTGFGFSMEDKAKPLSQFSGGEQTKIAFIRLLLAKPDVLLLDEPTNHLDVNSVQWLEGYLREYDRAVVMVSHDRYFLDETADVVYEAEAGRLTRYPGNYTHYRQEKQLRFQRQKKAYESQQEEIRRLEELVVRFKNKPNKAAFARSRKKILERMVPVEKPREDTARIHTGELTPACPGSRRVMEAEGLKIGYDRKQPLRVIDFRLQRGRKIGVLGANGSGKTTFLKTLAGRLPPLGGKLSVGSGVEIAYFDQQSAALDAPQSVREYFHERFPALTDREMREILSGYLFSGRDMGKRVADLSGGEKARLTLAVLLQPRPNLLLLDEPTNHMDIPARETLESLFQIYGGTMVFVSHDRYLIRQVADSLLIFEEDGRVLYYPFGYDHYREHVAGRKGAVGQRTAEEQAMIEGLRAAPKKSWLPGELSTESARRDWRFGLLEEEMEEARKQAEEIAAAREAEAIRKAAANVEMEACRMTEVDSVNQGAVRVLSQMEALRKREDAAAGRWTKACLDWYDEWLNIHEE